MPHVLRLRSHVSSATSLLTSHSSLVVIVLVTAIGIAACRQQDQTPPPPKTGPAIEARLIQTALVPVPVRIEVTGRVAAVTQATLASKIQGTIQDVAVREGNVVTKGQRLVTLDSRDLEATLTGADADLDNAKAQLDRMRQLYRDDAVSKQELENAERAFKMAESRRRIAHAQLSYTVIAAPFAGVITDKLVEPGELASPGQALLKLEDSAHLRLEATLAESDLPAVSIGARIPVIIDALGSQPLSGTVAKILPAGDPQTHTFLIKIDLPGVAGLKSGMFGRALVEKGAVKTLIAPKSAVLMRGDLSGVFVVGDDRIARLRWIKTGRIVSGTPSGEATEILSGLNPGEMILADATLGRDGATVQPVDAVASGPSKQ